MMKHVDRNGEVLSPDIRQNANGQWGVTLWLDHPDGVGTSVRRHYYSTCAEALAADIDDRHYLWRWCPPEPY